MLMLYGRLAAIHSGSGIVHSFIHREHSTQQGEHTHMQAIAVFPAAREVKLIDIPSPEISQPSEVKVRVLDVGICGTDREICAFHYGTPPEGAEYLILGHEAL